MQPLARSVFRCLSGLSCLVAAVWCGVGTAQSIDEHLKKMSKAKPDLDIYPREATGTTESGEKRDALSRDRELHLVIMGFETENKHASRWTARQIEKEFFFTPVIQGRG